MLKYLLLVFVMPALLGCNHLFYYPDNHEYLTPERLGLEKQEVWIPSNENVLHGYILKSKLEKSLGFVVHFHGNAQNLTGHLPFSFWLAHFGFDVLVFDYSGYGKSSGEPTRQQTVHDGRRVIQWIFEQQKQDVWVLGQSLGAAIANVAIAKEKDKPIKALVVDSSFASYRELARLKLASSYITWLFQYPLSYLISDDLSPQDYVSGIKIPTIQFHDRKDPIVPFAQGEALNAAFATQANFVVSSRLGHTPFFAMPDGKYRRVLMDFICDKLQQKQRCIKRKNEFRYFDDLEGLIPELQEDS